MLRTDGQGKDDLAAEWGMGMFSWQPENRKVTATHVTFRVKPLRISGQLQGSSVLIQTRFGRAHAPHLRRDGKAPVQMAQAFLQVPPWRQPVHEASPLEMGRGAADDKHMALEAKSGWHQLLKVTLY